MAILTKGTTFPSAGQVTSTMLNNIVDNAAFAAGAVDDSTIQLASGKVALKDAGVTVNKIADTSITPAKIKYLSELWVFADVTTTKSRLVPGTVAQSTTTMALDLANGNFQIVTLSEDVDTVSALGNLATGKQFTFLFKASGAKSITSAASWDSTWKFQGGVTPATTGTDGAYDVVSGFCDDTNAYVTMIKNFS